MKKVIIYMFLISIFLISLQSISAANIAVHPGESIQNAVDQASNGDNITVYDNNKNPYTYKESITINKKINIKSSGKVTIQAKNSSSSVFTVNGKGTGSSIQNFILSQSNYCIIINNANNCIISNNNIMAASLVGIQFYGNMSNSKVSGNNITGVKSTVGNGISFEYGKCTSNNITGNIISNFLNGILFNDNSEKNIVNNNRIYSSGYNGAGIYATDNSRSMQITGNTVTGAEDGIAIEQIGTYTPINYNINANTVSGNKNGFWICLSNSTISHNIANQNKVSGLDIKGKNNLILDNTASNNGNCGITLCEFTTADHNTVSGNTLNNNQAGLNSDSTYTTISNNNISFNTNNGLISTSKHNNIVSNTLKNNKGSAILLIGTYNTIKNNIIQNNVLGLYIQKDTNADYNTITYNNITYNSNGINSASPYSNFTHNNINNNNQNGLINTASHTIIDNNALKNNKGSAILLIGTYNTIKNNILQNNLIGICMQKSADADYNTVSYNNITYNGNGINSASPYSNFTHNNINYNNQTGLTITGEKCNIIENSMNYNKEAGLTITSSNNKVSENRLYNNLYGASFRNFNAATFNFNSVVGNTYQLYTADTKGTLNALNNWWGSNSAPTRVYGLFNVKQWIVLRLTGTATQIIGTTSTITADFTHNSAGVDISTLGHIKDGTTIYFTSTLGTINPTGTTKNGKATATFNPSQIGTAKITSKLDSQTVSTTIITQNAIKSVNLANYAINVSVNKVIKITFNTYIKFGTNALIELKTSSGKLISIIKTISGKILTITPTKVLAKGTKYTLIIHSSSITDLTGKGLPSFVINFTTSKS